MNKAIDKAKLSFFHSGFQVEDHFVDVTEMIRDPTIHWFPAD